MERLRTTVVSWIFSLGLAGLPIVVLYAARWAPLLILILLPLHRMAHTSRAGEPLRSFVICVSSIAVIILSRGWLAGGLSVLGFCAVGASAWLGAGWPGGRRPDAPDFLLIGLITLDLTLHPSRVNSLAWVPLLIGGFAARRAFRILLKGRRRETELGPPSREIRGTLSFSGILLGQDGLPRSSYLDLELRAGSSLALLCDSIEEAALLGEHLSGRQQSDGVQLCLDGEPPGPADKLCAYISRGERYYPGSLDANLGVFLDEDLGPGPRSGIWQACSLDEVAIELDGATMNSDGSPLSHFHRMLVQAARIIPSTYRVLIAVDPMPWVNAVRGGLWRAALLRACLGRTSIVLTADRELAACMDRVMYFRHGSLRDANSVKGA